MEVQVQPLRIGFDMLLLIAGQGQQWGLAAVAARPTLIVGSGLLLILCNYFSIITDLLRPRSSIARRKMITLWIDY
jgi:hypothetical protein